MSWWVEKKHTLVHDAFVPPYTSSPARREERASGTYVRDQQGTGRRDSAA